MRKYLLTPGPTTVPEEVLLQSALPVIHHRTEEFRGILVQVVDKIKKVFLTEGDVFVLSSSGTGGMEAACVNIVSPNDKVLVVSVGVFGQRWANILKRFGADVEILDYPNGQPFKIEDVKKKISQTKDIKALFCTLSETSTGTLNPIQELGEFIKNTGVVLVVDAVSGLAVDKLYTDEWGCDVVVAGSQKGLMMPPGLAFISVSKKAWGLIENNKTPRFYWDLINYKETFVKKETPFTPPVTMLVAASKSLDLILAEGMENVWKRHKILAEASRAGIKSLGLEIFSSSPCAGVTSVKVPKEISDGTKINKLLSSKYGVKIAGGQKDLKGKIFRIAHMGNVGMPDVIVGLSCLEMVLYELGYKIELASGVAEAQKVFLNSK